MANGGYFISRKIAQTELRELASDKFFAHTVFQKTCNFDTEVPVIIMGNTILPDTEPPVSYFVFNNCMTGTLIQPAERPFSRNVYVHLSDDVSLWLVKLMKYCVEITKSGENNRSHTAKCLDNAIRINNKQYIKIYSDMLTTKYMEKFDTIIGCPFMDFLTSQGIEMGNYFSNPNAHDRGLWFYDTRKSKLLDIGDILERYLSLF